MHTIGIIGGGSAGLYLSYLLSKKGIENIVFEEHSEIGKPLDCSGLLDPGVFKELPLSESLIKEEFKEVFIHSPDGEKIKIRREDPLVYSIDRIEMEKELARMAKKQGSEVKTNTRIEKIGRDNSKFILTSEDEEFEVKILIGADGALSLVGGAFGLTDQQRHIKGLEYIFPNEESEKNFHVYFDPGYSKKRYAWRINGKHTKVGLLDKMNCKAKLQSLVNELDLDPEEGQLIGKFVPTKLLKNFAKGRLALLGDAAGQNFPLVGGGIYLGMKGAEILSETIEEMEKGRLDSLKKYEKRFKSKFGSSLKLESKAEGSYPETKEKREELFRFIKKHRDMIEEHFSVNLHLVYKNFDFKDKLKVLSMLFKWKI